MNAFLSTNGHITRCDLPAVGGSYAEVAQSFGFEPYDTSSTLQPGSHCVVCRPANQQEVYLTIHGIERNIYALVLWDHGASTTLIFVPTPFDLVTTVEYLARYEKALYELQHYAALRQKQ
ncbi:MAG TPA: hypothetical protein VFZ66_03925 [Herpetosiphonaceae bacterium]